MGFCSGFCQIPGMSSIAPRRRPRPSLEEFRAFYDIGDRSYFGFHLVLAARFFDRQVSEVLRSQGIISLQQWRVVSQLWLREKLTVRGLADHAAVDRAEVSRAVGELERMGYVERQENPGDRRSPLLSLTAEGRRIAEEVRRPVRAVLDAMIADIADDDLEAAERALRSFTMRAFSR